MTDPTNAERQANWYKRKKEEGSYPRTIKLDKQVKDRFTCFREDMEFSINEAMIYLLEKQGY